MDLRSALALHVAALEKQARQQAEFVTTRPTPTRAENDAMLDGDIVTVKQWDLSPIVETSPDPSEPPGRPMPVPVRTNPPEAIGTPTIGSAALA
jgi:hypothetical protein